MSDFVVLSIVYFSMALIFLVLGGIMRRKGRGYNSFGRAMASVEAQNFAAKYAGGKMILFTLIVAVPMIILSVITIVLRDNATITQVFFWIQMVLVMLPPIVTVILTEMKLRRHFDKNGRPYR